ncbi:patatin family protein [Solibacillus sp. CAU 1738]|uniref:patatin-like phospholipase family protein n=1 Tax=Solibacillus sp. CAU 1738 TaxID=3140363 RepID=UPI003260D9F1
MIQLTNTSLILEGGTFRTIYSGGVLDAFLDHNVHLPYILAISAGAINACSYVSKQKERTLRVFTNYRHDKRYMGINNFFKERSLFGLDFAYNVIPNELDLFDWDTYQQFDGKLEIGVTNAYTGQVEYMDALQMDKECMMLRATCAIPVLFPEIKLNNVPYYDGGLADPIPVFQAEEKGYDKHVIVLTRPKGYRKTLDRQTKFAMKLLSKRYPALVQSMLQRADKYNETIAYCEQLEAEGKAFLFRPDHALNSFEKHIPQIHKNYAMGYEQSTAQMEALKQFIDR